MSSQQNAVWNLPDFLGRCGFDVFLPNGEPDERFLKISGSLDNAAFLMETAMAGNDDPGSGVIEAPFVVRQDKAPDLIRLVIGCGFTVRCPDEVDVHHPFAISGTFENVRRFLAAAVDARVHYHPGVFTCRLMH